MDAAEPPAIWSLASSPSFTITCSMSSRHLKLTKPESVGFSPVSFTNYSGVLKVQCCWLWLGLLKKCSLLIPRSSTWSGGKPWVWWSNTAFHTLYHLGRQCTLLPVLPLKGPETTYQQPHHMASEALLQVSKCPNKHVKLNVRHWTCEAKVNEFNFEWLLHVVNDHNIVRFKVPMYNFHWA